MQTFKDSKKLAQEKNLDYVYQVSNNVSEANAETLIQQDSTLVEDAVISVNQGVDSSDSEQQNEV